MRRVFYLLIMVVFVVTNLKLNDALASKIDPVTSFLQVTEADVPDQKDLPTDQKDLPPNSLDEIVTKDAHSEGAIQNILGGLALFYNILANLLLYPIFSFLLLLLSLGAIVLIAFWIKKIKDEKPISTKWILFTCLYLLFYLDLFLVVYQKKEVLFLFIELEKDLFLTIAAASIGYIVGKFCSSKSLEEKKLP